MGGGGGGDYLPLPSWREVLEIMHKSKPMVSAISLQATLTHI